MKQFSQTWNSLDQLKWSKKFMDLDSDPEHPTL